MMNAFYACDSCWPNSYLHSYFVVICMGYLVVFAVVVLLVELVLCEFVRIKEIYLFK